jgi:hypothetical protein
MPFGPADTGRQLAACEEHAALQSTYVTVKARRLVNPSIYHSEVVNVRKMLVKASISGFYQTTAVNDSSYQHQLVKAYFV